MRAGTQGGPKPGAAPSAGSPGAPLGIPALIFLLFLMAFSAVSVDALVPGLPAIAADYEVSEQAAQSVLSYFVFGAAVGTLLCGMLADRHGRRYPMLIGVSVYLAASVGCVMSNSLETLTFWRTLQGIGAAVGPTLSATVIGDVYGRNQAAAMFSKLAGFMAFLPGAMPFIGSWIIVNHDWRGIFILLLCFGLITGIGLLRYIPETRQRLESRPPIADYFKAHVRVVTDGPFVMYTLVVGFSFAGLFAYISANSFIVIETLGVPQSLFGFTFLVLPAGFFFGSQFGAVLVKRRGLEPVILLGCAISLAVSAVSVALSMLGILSLWVLLAPAFLYTIGVGLVMSNAHVGAMKSRPMEMATASGITGCTRLGFGAVAGHLSLEGFGGDALTMVSVMFVCALLATATSASIYHSARSRPAPQLTSGA